MRNARVIALIAAIFCVVHGRSILAEGWTGGPQRVTGTFPHSTGKSVGVLRVLYVPMRFLDQNATPASEATCYEVMEEVADFYQKQSFGKLTVQTTVAPPVRLPRAEAYYIAKDFEVDGLSLEHSDALNAARELGYDSNDYDCSVVRLAGGPRAAGGWGGAGRVWTYSDNPSIVAHELGHTLGLAHANFWNTGGVSTIGSGASQEYGDIWDVMGVGGAPNGHFNIWAKQNVNWLPAAQIWDVKQSGTYRIFAHDTGTLQPARFYGLKITKDSARTYFVEARQLRDDDPNQVWLKNGAVLEWRWPAKAGNDLLLDTTPGSLFGKDDGGLVLGRTFSDREAGIHLTPIAVDFGAQKSVDLVVNLGSFPGNAAPSLSLSAATISVPVGATVSIDAIASDVNGDPLSYFWETGEMHVYENSPHFARTFTTAGMYQVACTVSDMKGGTTMRYAVVNVGTHSQFHISGRVTLGGGAVAGVLVKSSTRQAYTDADGFFTLAGLDSGTQTIAVAKEGFTFIGTTEFALAADVNDADFIAVSGTQVSLGAANPTAIATASATPAIAADDLQMITVSAPDADAREVTNGSPNPGVFLVSRTGVTTLPLTLYYSLAGSAIHGVDFDALPGSITIPAGESSAKIVIVPTADGVGEGAETVQLLIASLGSQYQLSGTGTATLQIADSPADPATIEVRAADDFTFRLTARGGSGAAIAVNYTVGGDATSGVDFVALSGVAILPAGTGTRTVDVVLTPIAGRTSDTLKVVTLTLAEGAGYNSWTQTRTAELMLKDGTTPVVFASPFRDAPREGELGSGFYLSRTGPTTNALAVHFTLGGTAQNGADYVAIPLTATIPAGASGTSVIVTPIDDAVPEGTETITLTLTSSDYRASPVPATLYLGDNDSPLATVQFATASGVAQENAGTVDVIVTLSGSISAPATVEYTIGSGPVANTALGAGVDYVLGGGPVGTLRFSPGETTKRIPLTIIDDAVRETDERIVLRLRNANGVSLGTSATFILTIADDDSGFGGWQRAHFGSDANSPEIAGELADPDLDGVVNLLEYAQNLDPNSPDAAVPICGCEPGFLTLTYRRNIADVELVWTVEETRNLADANSWTPASALQENVSDDGITRVIKTKVPSTGEAGHFLRLRVTRN